MNYWYHILIIMLLFGTFSCSNNLKTTEYTLSGIPYEDNDSVSYGIIYPNSDVIFSGFAEATSPVINVDSTIAADK